MNIGGNVRALADENFISFHVVYSANCRPVFSSSFYPFKWICSLLSRKFMAPIMSCHFLNCIRGILHNVRVIVSFMMNFNHSLSESIQLSPKNNYKNTYLKIKSVRPLKFQGLGRTLLERGIRSRSIFWLCLIKKFLYLSSFDCNQEWIRGCIYLHLYCLRLDNMGLVLSLSSLRLARRKQYFFGLPIDLT